MVMLALPSFDRWHDMPTHVSARKYNNRFKRLRLLLTIDNTNHYGANRKQNTTQSMVCQG
jgi:hypothetical protein